MKQYRLRMHSQPTYSTVVAKSVWTPLLRYHWNAVGMVYRSYGSSAVDTSEGVGHARVWDVVAETTTGTLKNVAPLQSTQSAFLEAAVASGADDEKLFHWGREVELPQNGKAPPLFAKGRLPIPYKNFANLKTSVVNSKSSWEQVHQELLYMIQCATVRFELEFWLISRWQIAWYSLQSLWRSQLWKALWNLLLWR